ncbi:hypothetical protein ACX1Q6_001525 [Enterococcus hirae]
MKDLFKSISKDLIVELAKLFLIPVIPIILAKISNIFLKTEIPIKYIAIICGIIFIFFVFNLFRALSINNINNLQEAPSRVSFISPAFDAQLGIVYENCYYILDLREYPRSEFGQYKNTPSKYTLVDIYGPLCPKCRLSIKEKRKLFGKYKHFCSKNHISFTNKFSNNSMLIHAQTYYSDDSLLNEKISKLENK